MKKTMRIAGWVALVLAALFLGVEIFGGQAIKHSVNFAGPKMLGVPVTLRKAAISPFRARIILHGLKIGNPEGFKTPSLLDVKLLDIDLEAFSLLKKVIVVSEIRVKAPEITFERALKTSNIAQLMDRFGEDKPEPAPDEEEMSDPAGKKTTRKVVIRKLTVSDAQVNVSMTAMRGHSVILPLPTISMTDIGGTGNDAPGVSFENAIKHILRCLFKAVSDLVAGAGKSVVGGAKSVGSAAAGGVHALGDEAGKLVDAVGGLFSSDE